MSARYHVLERVNDDRFPLFDYADKETGFALSRREPVGASFIAQLRVSEPIHKMARLVDYHPVPAPAFSKRVAATIDPRKLHKVQLVPAVVTFRGQRHDYVVLHVLNFLTCIDRTRSELTLNASGSIFEAHKLVLDQDLLAKVSPNERALFRLQEKTSTYLVEHSVVASIQSAKPEGVRFIPVEQWSDAVAFQ